MSLPVRVQDPFDQKGAIEALRQCLGQSGPRVLIMRRGCALKADWQTSAPQARVNPELCDGCGYCVDPCAFGALKLIEFTEAGEVKKLADRIIDTSDYTVHDLRQSIERHYAEHDEGRPMVITLVTFGYKFGVPYELDLLFDLRFLPNPHFDPGVRRHTGEDARVREYIMARPDSTEFVTRLQEFLEYLLPRYRKEGKSYLTIGFGCTGGRHRSVAVSLVIAERLRQSGYDVNLKHRDMGT